MNRTLTIVALIALAFSFQAQAKPGILKGFQAAYPKTKLLALANKCTICHIEDSEENERNVYGADLEKTKHTGGLPDFKAVEALDSDGDGFTNIQEINAGSNPSDKSDVPAAVGAN